MVRTPPAIQSAGQRDFTHRLISLTTELQRSILDEHARTLEIHENRQHGLICNLRQENRRLRQRLFNESDLGGNDEGYPDFPEEMLPDLPEAMKSCRPAHSNGEAGWHHLLAFPTTPKASPIGSPRVHVAFAQPQKEISSNDEKGTHHARSGSSLQKTHSRFSIKSKTGSKSSFHLENFEVWPEWEFVEGEDSQVSQGGHLNPHEDEIEYTRESTWVDEHGTAETDSYSKFVFSPYSLKILLWEMLGLPLLLYDLLTIPMEVFHLPPNAMFRQSLSKVVVIYWTLDIFRKIITGYVARDGVLVMVHHKIWAYYLFSHRFALDATITLVDWLSVIGLEGEMFAAAGTVRVTKVARVYRLIRVLRLVRLRKLHKLMNLMQDVVNSAVLSTMLTITFNLGLVLGITHCLACLWYWIGTTMGDWFPSDRESWTSVAFRPEDGWHYRYFTSLHWAITQFTPGSMEVQPKNTQERCYAVIALVFGIVVFSSFISSVTNQMAHMQSFSAKYRQQFWLFRRYCRQHNVSEGLVLRVNRYINLVLRPQMGTVQFKDVQLFPLLSQPLYIELLTELHVPQLTSHPFFECLCRTGPYLGMVRKLCLSAVRQDYFSCNDVVFCKGQVSNDMYFINKGNLRYSYKLNGSAHVGQRTFHPLRESDWCCEAGLWTFWAHAGTLCASTECILVLLNSANFRSSCSEYKLDLMLVRRYGHLFVRHLVDLYQEGVVITDILSNRNSPLETSEMQKLITAAAGTPKTNKSLGSLTMDGVASLFPEQLSRALKSSGVDSQYQESQESHSSRSIAGTQV